MRGRGFSPAIVAAVAALCVHAAKAEGQAPLSFAIDGSLPLGWSSNPAHDHSNNRAGYIFSPYLQLSASGSIARDTAYLFYVNTNFDKSLTKTTDDSDELPQAAMGATLQHRWGDFSFHMGVERNFFFNEVYSSSNSAANDFSFGVRYRYATPDGNLRIRPVFTFTTRVNDSFDVERHLYSGKIDFDRRLSGPWWLLVTPRLRYYGYQLGINDGRRDLASSISVGLRYVFNENASFTTSAAYEHRSSNRPDKNFENVMIGASLDFSFGFDGPDWIYQRSSGATPYARAR